MRTKGSGAKGGIQSDETTPRVCVQFGPLDHAGVRVGNVVFQVLTEKLGSVHETLQESLEGEQVDLFSGMEVASSSHNH